MDLIFQKLKYTSGFPRMHMRGSGRVPLWLGCSADAGGAVASSMPKVRRRSAKFLSLKFPCSSKICGVTRALHFFKLSIYHGFKVAQDLRGLHSDPHQGSMHSVPRKP